MNSLTSAVFLLLGLAIGQVGTGGRAGVIIALIAGALLLLMIQELHRMGAFEPLIARHRRNTNQRWFKRLLGKGYRRPSESLGDLHSPPSEPLEVTVNIQFHPHPQGQPCTEACGDLHKAREEAAP